MLTVKEILSDKITLDIECVDRVYLNGFIKYLQMPGGLVNFIRQQKKLPIPSPKVLGEMTVHFREEVERFAAEQGLEIVAFGKGDDKDAIAREHLAHFTRKSGVVLIGRAQEKTSAFQGRRADRGTKVWFDYHRHNVLVLHYYFYILDEAFGLFFIKVCTYLPFEVKVCFNGHEWAKQQVRQEGIGFEALDNGFLTCEHPTRLQAICLQLNAEKIQALFDRWVDQLPWPLTREERAAGYGHQLSVWQIEISRTQVFADPEQGRALIEGLIRDNLDLGRPDRVNLIFERRVTKRTPGEFYTRVIREGVLPSIRIHYKHSVLKQYFKDGRALRTEMMINNAQDFGIQRGLSNFTTLVELGRRFNDHLLEQERISQDCFVPLDEMRRLGQSMVLDNGQRASALRFGEPRVMSLLSALARHAYIPSPLDNRTLRPLIGRFKTTLSWTAAKSGKRYSEYDEDKTTRVCCACGCKVERGIALDIREWVCPECGAFHLRDENAAQNGLTRVLKQKHLPRSGHTPEVNVLARWAWRVSPSGVVATLRGRDGSALSVMAPEHRQEIKPEAWPGDRSSEDVLAPSSGESFRPRPC